MSYSKTDQDRSKRIQKLQSQLYGKEEVTLPSIKNSNPIISNGSFRFQSSHMVSHVKETAPTKSEYFLRNDLIKVMIFASIAIGLQLLLYLGKIRGLVSL